MTETPPPAPSPAAHAATTTDVALTRWVATACLLALIALCLAWELALAPARPGGSWLALKALPLCLPLAGFLKNRMYTYRWVSLVIWLYFTEGVVRGWSDKPPSQWLALAEVALCVALFVACTLHVRLRQRNANAVSANAPAHSVAAPAATEVSAPTSPTEPTYSIPYLNVKTWQLILLASCSFQLYLVYWFYRHWRTVQQRYAMQISPAARAVMSSVYCYPLLNRIRHEAKFFKAPSFSAGWLSAGYVVSTFAGTYFALLGAGNANSNPTSTSDALVNAVGWFVFLLPGVLLAPVQRAINHINAELHPDRPASKGMPLVEWGIVALGMPITIYAMYSSFAP